MEFEKVKESEIKYPPWWGDEEIHGRHRANLIRKDPNYYGNELKWTEQPKNGKENFSLQF